MIPGRTILRWECAYCGGFREDASTCPGCGAPRTVEGYEMEMELYGPRAFRGLRFGPAPVDAAPAFVFSSADFT